FNGESEYALTTTFFDRDNERVGRMVNYPRFLAQRRFPLRSHSVQGTSESYDNHPRASFFLAMGNLGWSEGSVVGASFANTAQFFGNDYGELDESTGRAQRTMSVLDWLK